MMPYQAVAPRGGFQSLQDALPPETFSNCDYSTRAKVTIVFLASGAMGLLGTIMSAEELSSGTFYWLCIASGASLFAGYLTCARVDECFRAWCCSTRS